MTISETIIRESVQRYERELDRYLKLCTRVAEICRTDIIESNAIRAQITFRAKSPKSFEAKLRRKAVEGPDAWACNSVDAVFARIGDLAGVRVSTYERTGEEEVVRRVVALFTDRSGGTIVPDIKDKHRKSTSHFYRATHCEVYLKPEGLVGTYENLTETPCEIQICSMMAHVWNEIEHDIQYKPRDGEVSDQVRELLESLGHTTRVGDQVIALLIQATVERQKGSSDNDAFEDVYDFVARMRDRFQVKAFGSESGQLFDELISLGLNTPRKIIDNINLDEAYLIRAYHAILEFNTWLEQRGYEPQAMNPDTADILLIGIMDKHCGTIADNHPGGRGQGRPPRIAWLARRYIDYRLAEPRESM